MTTTVYNDGIYEQEMYVTGLSMTATTISQKT